MSRLLCGLPLRPPRSASLSRRTFFNSRGSQRTPLPSGTKHGAAPPSVLSAGKALVLPDSESGSGHATSGRLVTLGLRAGRGAVLCRLLRDLQRPRGAEVQPQLLPSLPAAVLEQEEGAARVSHLQEEVLSDRTHGEPGAEERGRHLPEGAGDQDGRGHSAGEGTGVRGAGGAGGRDVCGARGSSQTLLPG